VELQAYQIGSGRLSVRPYTVSDRKAVLALMEADRLPGRPAATPGNIHWPPSGPGQDPAETVVLLHGHDQLTGAARLGVRAADSAGMLWWLHADEDCDALTALISFARARLGARRVLRAFTEPAGTPAGANGLPVRHRPATAHALAAAGFTAVAAHHFFRRPIVVACQRLPSYPLATISETTDPPGWRLVITDADGTALATAVMYRPATGVAVLSRVAVHPDHRSRSIGGHLLNQCIHHAAAHGCGDITAITAEDDTAAARLLTGHGFILTDTLTAYHRRP
jgi:ribosomal protein S18 acetylase RimI-like enzyme